MTGKTEKWIFTQTCIAKFTYGIIWILKHELAVHIPRMVYVRIRPCLACEWELARDMKLSKGYRNVYNLGNEHFHSIAPFFSSYALDSWVTVYTEGKERKYTVKNDHFLNYPHFCFLHWVLFRGQLPYTCYTSPFEIRTATNLWVPCVFKCKGSHLWIQRWKLCMHI